MGKIVLLIVLGFLFSVAQSILILLGVPPYFVPHCIVILVVFSALTETSLRGVILAFLLGLILDFSAAQLVGPWAGGCVVVYAVLTLLSQRLFVDSAAVSAVVSFLAVLVADGVYVLLSSQYRELGWEVPVQLLGQACSSALVAPIVLGMLRSWFRRGTDGRLSRRGLSAVG